MLEAIFSTIPKQNPINRPASSVSSKLKSTSATPTIPIKPIANPESATSEGKRTLRRRTTKTTGIIQQALHPQQEAEEAEVRAITYGLEEKLNNPINQSELNEIWRGFVRKLASRPALQSAMMKTPGIKNEHCLILEVSSKIAEEEISKIKPDLLGYLKRHLRNSYLELQTIVIEADEIEGKPMTESEIFLEMMKKNPNLQKLISLLELEMN